METATAASAASSFGSSSIRASFKSPISIFPSSISSPNFLTFASISPSSSLKYSTISHGKQRRRQMSLRRGICTVVRASLSSSEFHDSPASVAPLRMESPTGQFLSQILASHPHLVPAAVEQQLEQLERDRDAEKQKEEPSATGSNLVLYRRIAEVKASERKKALEEILYALVVQKFINANVSLIPSISPTSETAGRVDSWADEDEKLQRLHSPEAYEMVQHHLSVILGSRLHDSNSVAQISKLKVGQVYAASIMYGYFLKRIDQRFQLEKTMKILPGGSRRDVEAIDQHEGEEVETLGNASWISPNPQVHPEVTTWSGGDVGAAGSTQGVKSFSRLRNYVMAFDGDNLQRFATIRSREAVSIIEKHTEALFGRPEIVITPQGTIDSSNDEQIKISFGGLRRLFLEAVTFGSFLWDAESYVDTRYHFVAN